MRKENEIKYIADALDGCSVGSDYFIYQKIFLDALNYVLGAELPIEIEEEICRRCIDDTDECGQYHIGSDECMAVKYFEYRDYKPQDNLNKEPIGMACFNGLIERAHESDFVI